MKNNRILNDFDKIMGRYYFNKKDSADDLNKKIDLAWLKKKNLLNGYASTDIIWTTTSAWGKTRKSSASINIDTSNPDNKYLRIYYTQTNRDTGDKRDFDYKILITTTPCNYGGTRYWFICPWYKNGIYCGKRVRVLYMGGDYFACRHCYNLTYDSRNISAKIRNYPLGMLLLDKQIEDLEKKIKRKFYNKKPTKKYNRLLKLCHQFSLFGNMAKLWHNKGVDPNLKY